LKKKLRARTYLLVQKNPDKKPIVAGYFTIAISILYAKDIKKEILLKIGNFKSPRDIPCLLIGQFAKSDKFENLKLGEVLMKYALEKLKEVNEIIGSRFILLDSINNEKVIKFYEKFGFIKIEKRKFPLKKSKIKKLKQRKNSIKMIRAFI
jgi:GNAT superfamily N-acetyltransferase